MEKQLEQITKTLTVIENKLQIMKRNSKDTHVILKLDCAIGDMYNVIYELERVSEIMASNV